MTQPGTRVLFAAGPVTERGGPSKYVRHLPRYLEAHGLHVRTVHFRLYKAAVPGLRHIAFFLRLLIPALRSDVILAFDTWSVGIPALLAAKITGRRLVVRVGGDFLWERYIERTGDPVRLSDFYQTRRSNFSLTERIIFAGTHLLLTRADLVLFNSAWQKDIWKKVYGTSARSGLLENHFPAYTPVPIPSKKVFVCAGRRMRMRNTELVEQAFARVQERYPDISLDTRHLDPDSHAKRMESCYAVIQATVSDVAPNMVIEAVARGIPFICTEDTGIADCLEGCGEFIPMEQGALEKAIERMLDTQAYQALRDRIRIQTLERSWGNVADDLARFLTSWNSGRKP